MEMIKITLYCKRENGRHCCIVDGYCCCVFHRHCLLFSCKIMVRTACKSQAYFVMLSPRLSVTDTICLHFLFLSKQTRHGRNMYPVSFDMYMSYRRRESFNTVNRQIRDVITTGIDMCGRRMRKGGGGWTIHPSRRWLISCARTAVLYLFLSIALTSCTASMAETNLGAIRKQKNVEYSKRYRLKRKMKMQQQAPTTSEAEPEKLQV